MKRCSLGIIVVLALVMIAPPAQAQLDVLRNLGKTIQGGKQIAHFRIKGALTETPNHMPPLFGGEPPLSLKSLLERFKEARHDNNVVAVVIDLQDAALGLAQLQEIHRAMRKFAAVDKEVFVHADALTTITYAAATGASNISVVPTGDVWLVGLYGEMPYLRGALEKLGCVPDFEQFEDFKTAAELITRTGPSEQSKQMTKWLFDGIYDDLVTLIADSRGMSPEKVRALIDDGPYNAEAALKAGLIDSVKHRQDLIADLKARFGSSTKFVTNYGKRDVMDIPDDPFALFSWLMQLFNPSPKVYTKPSIAIVYVEGVIVTGAAQLSPFGPASGAFSTTIRKALDKAAGDDSVKAVVLRVDSPGGSALASEIILDATIRVAAKKPLIVSMGNVAGSGGYYVACGAETIFANRSTITASIGVLGGKLVTTGLWDKLGINWHAVKRGKMAAMLSSAERFNDAERAKIRHYMKTVYEIFKKHVTDSRGDRLAKPIDEIAGGRVFTGAQALDLGLVDKIGGLEDAIRFAARRASLGEYEIRVIPEPPNIFDLLSGNRDADEFFGSSSVLKPALLDSPPFRTLLPVIAKLDPLRAKAVVRALQRIELIHREGVVTIMPTEFVIR
ncbi:MAG: signal peptide peptidase SppA [Planctomycetes bacterium]|nr:signal peptide peptidase SppA [Planctomycetota bacterium]